MGVYESLGLEPIINACGPTTRVGGAPMPRAVLEAFNEAAGGWVPLEHLQAAASRVIAQLTGAEAGLVTAGSAAGLTLGAAAMLTRYDLGKMERLPCCEGFAHEFVVAREHRNGYDHAVRAAGAQFVEVGFNEIVSGAGVRRTEAWEYEAAFTADTAGVLYVLTPDSRPTLEEVVRHAHRRNIPVLVDAAGELPPRSNLRLASSTGADLVSFSGGKSIRGPQSTGILCGRKDLIAAAALQMLDMDDHLELWAPPAGFIDKSQLDGIPRHGIGRPMKVSKEEIVALITALKMFAEGEYVSELEANRECLRRIVELLKDAPVKCQIGDAGDGESLPILEITIDETLGRAALEVCQRLRQGAPPIYVGHGKLHEETLVVHPLCLTPHDAETLGRRLLEELRP